MKSLWFCVSGYFGEKHACLQKMLPRGEVVTRCRSGIRHRNRHSQFWGWHKVVPVCGILNVSNPYSTGSPWSIRNRQGVQWIRLCPSWCHAAAIGEQMVDVCTEWSCFAKRLCLAASPISAAQKGGPDWIG